MVCGFTKQNQKCGYRVLSILRDYKERCQVKYDQSQWAQEECGAVLCPQHRCGRNCFSSGVSPGNLHRPYSIITKDLISPSPSLCYHWGSMQNSWLAFWWCSALMNTHLNMMWDVPPNLHLQSGATAIVHTRLLASAEWADNKTSKVLLASPFQFLFSCLQMATAFTLFTACNSLSLRDLPA